jgi:hypothetical protein
MMTGAMGTAPEWQLQIAAEQSRHRKTVTALADVALHGIEGDHRAVLRVAAGIGGTLALLGGGKHLHHDDDGEQADHHADHDLDQAEAGLPGTRITGSCLHVDFLYRIWAMATY